MSVNKVSQDTGELITLSSGVRCWIGTKAAHTIAVANHTIPNNVMVCITDDWKNKDDYSTEETDTGKHWIDGKPVYRKVLSGVSEIVGENSRAYIPTGVSDIDVVIALNVFAHPDNTGSVIWFPGSTLAGVQRGAYYNGNNNWIDAYWVGDATKAGITITAIIEYTKTTD